MADDTPGSQPPPWSLPSRIAFRFGVVYLTLFALATQLTGSLLPNPFFYYRGLGHYWPMRDLSFWTAEHVLGTPAAADEVTAAGEPLFFWAQLTWLLALSIAIAAVWSLLDRRRTQYHTAHAWFRLAVRFVLAAAMFEYGMTKVIPTQFPAPALTTLVTPTGDLTLSALLWTTIGASPAYQVLSGVVEVIGAVLLVLPWTTLLGAVITLGAALQVWTLNMTFDIGLKVVSFHLVVLALVLIAPDARRLLDFFVRHRPVAARTEPAVVRSAQGRRALVLAQIALGVYLLAMYSYINIRFWDVGGGGRARPALYGIWEVEQMTVDGETRPPSENDYDRRWRRVIVETPDEVAVQRTDDSFARYGARLDAGAGTLALTKRASQSWRSAFTFALDGDDGLQLEGTMDGRRLDVRLRRVHLDTFRLLNSPFRWMRKHEQER